MKVLWPLPLCQSQARVARLVTEGKTNPEIASIISGTLEQVKMLVERACENAGCKNRVQLAVWVTRYDYESAIDGPPKRYDGTPFSKRRKIA